ncbi:Retrovirus-related Pol polyprotein from transposon TNT 1-94 [Vitis vinifera]|uniref:Retrovirus-related Pol polyprotein from transposon TNT 1-94 n=1 Tax=Vitis vinifera TaxID=29760 RepID=A0A438GWI7_VITVI|nr:Retrovirus-related Pol polyprotein from transposon TNT 1-94 [Vitis vinifera]
MAEEAGKMYGIEKFECTDFAYWIMQIEDYLYGRKLHLPFLGTKPESMKAKEWTLLNRQVLGVIRLTLSSGNTSTSKEKQRGKTSKVKRSKEDSSCSLLSHFWSTFRSPFFAYYIPFQISGSQESNASNHARFGAEMRNIWPSEANCSSFSKYGCYVMAWMQSHGNFSHPEEIDFDDEIRALIVLASLPNSWETEIRRRDASETSKSGSALNLETRGRGHFRRQCKTPKKNNEDDSSNAVIEEVQDALILVVDSPLDDWVLDSGASFHTTPHREIIQNYVVGDFGKVYLADGLALDVVDNLMMKDMQYYLLVVLGRLQRELGYWLMERRPTWSHSEKGMKMLLSKGKLPELKSIDFDMCESCILGKQKRASFLKIGKTPKAEKLELVHTDLWGPSPIASLGDNGREYIDEEFREYCAAQGIRIEKTIPGTPQQNGVAERMNKTLNERARRPSIPMEFKLPEEVWSGKEVKFSHLKVFGCVSYIHIDSDARRKLDAKSKICFFIGYGYEIFGYRSTVVSDVIEIDQKKFEFVNLDELTESTVQKKGEEDKENVNSQPKCYDEALQDENSSKWELAIKDEMDSLLGNRTSELIELLARLVVKGFQQKEGIDYIEIFSLVVKMSTIKLVLGMVASENLHLEQLDVKTAFFHGSDIEKINNMKKQFSKQFAMKDLGATKQILGMRITRDKANGTLKLSQSEYVKKVLSKFNISEAKPMSTPLGSHFKLSKEQSP